MTYESNSFDDLIEPKPTRSIFDGEPPADDTAKPISLAKKIWNETPQAQRPKTIAADTWNGIKKAGIGAVGDAVMFYDRLVTPRMGQSPEDYEKRLQRDGVYSWAKDVKAGSDYAFPTNPAINSDPFSKAISGLGALAPAVALGAIPGIGLAAGAAFMGGAVGNQEFDRAREEGASIDQAKLHSSASAAITGTLNAVLGGVLRFGRIGSAAAKRQIPGVIKNGVDSIRAYAAENPGSAAYAETILRQMAEQPVQGAAIDALSNLTYGSNRNPLDAGNRFADLAMGGFGGAVAGAGAAGRALRARREQLASVAREMHIELTRPPQREPDHSAMAERLSSMAIPAPVRKIVEPIPESRIEVPASKTESPAPKVAPLAPVEAATAPVKPEASYYTEYIRQEFGQGYTFEQTTLPDRSGGISAKPGEPKTILIDPAILRRNESMSYEPSHFLAMLDDRIWETQRGATPDIKIEPPLPAPAVTATPTLDTAAPLAAPVTTPKPRRPYSGKTTVPKWRRKRKLYWPQH